MANKQSDRLSTDYSNVLVAIFELMLRGGVCSTDLQAVCTRSLQRAETKVRSGRIEESGGLVTAALVLDAWHRDRRYLDSRAMPKPIRLLGAAPSVEAIIRSHKAHREAADIARRLRSLRLVVPSGRGRFKPASDVAVISAGNPLVLQHAARALSTLLETVGKNVSSTRGLRPLIERVAEVPDLPKEHVVEFQKFTQAQGRSFLRTINDWLESRRARNSRRRGKGVTVRAGVHTYAYVAPTRRQRSEPS
jgi:Family of unknown function (DUF6502)